MLSVAFALLCWVSLWWLSWCWGSWRHRKMEIFNNVGSEWVKFLSSANWYYFLNVGTGWSGTILQNRRILMDTPRSAKLTSVTRFKPVYTNSGTSDFCLIWKFCQAVHEILPGSPTNFEIGIFLSFRPILCSVMSIGWMLIKNGQTAWQKWPDSKNQTRLLRVNNPFRLLYT